MNLFTRRADSWLSEYLRPIWANRYKGMTGERRLARGAPLRGEHIVLSAVSIIGMQWRSNENCSTVQFNSSTRLPGLV